jgi:pseudouridine-5'-monophosphatase
MAEPLRCRAIIFDCDGLLLDTEELYNEAARKVLEKHGYSRGLYTDAVRQHVVGLSELEGAANAVREMNVDISPKDFFEEREAFLVDLFPHCQAMKGAKELVLKVLASGIPCGVATSANRNAFELKVCDLFTFFFCSLPSSQLTNHRDWVGQLPFVTGCQLPPGRGKPQPDIFLRVAEMIGFKGRESEVLVFEVSLYFERPH